MDRIPLAIVGCGGMGHRHLFGLAELHRAGLSRFDLVAAVDPVTDNANSLADHAEEFFGKRPAVVGSLEKLGKLDVAAVDITTTPRYHHTLGVEAIAARLARHDREAGRLDRARLQPDRPGRGQDRPRDQRGGELPPRPGQPAGDAP